MLKCLHKIRDDKIMEFIQIRGIKRKSVRGLCQIYSHSRKKVNVSEFLKTKTRKNHIKYQVLCSCAFKKFLKTAMEKITLKFSFLQLRRGNYYIKSPVILYLNNQVTLYHQMSTRLYFRYFFVKIPSTNVHLVCDSLFFTLFYITTENPIIKPTLSFVHSYF